MTALDLNVGARRDVGVHVVDPTITGTTIRRLKGPVKGPALNTFHDVAKKEDHDRD